MVLGRAAACAEVAEEWLDQMAHRTTGGESPLHGCGAKEVEQRFGAWIAKADSERGLGL